MSGIKPIFRGASGLNTVVDPVRLPFDPETLISALGEAVNVVVDTTGRVSRRDGYANLFPGASHSLFCDGGDCLFVEGDSLYRLLPDYSRQLVKDGLIVGNLVDYTQVNNDIYYTSKTDVGMVRQGGIHEDWTARPYVGVDTNRRYAGPQPASHIAFFAGRIFLSIGNSIIYSEPFGWSYFDLSRCFFSLDSTVRMMKPVADGIYLSSDTQTYFLKGTEPKEWLLIEVAGYPALEWSAAIDLVDGLEVGIQEQGLCALWSSPMGACLGTPAGNVYNLTRDKVIYPEGTAGAGLLRGYHFIQTIGE